MKKITLLIFLTSLSSIVFSQNAFYDSQFLNTVSNADLQNILDASDATKFTAPMKPYINLSGHEIGVVKDYQRFLANPFDATIANLDLTAFKSAVGKYNSFVESEKLVGANGAGNRYGFAATGLVSALSLIPNIIGGNFSLSTDQQTKIIDGLTKYYAEEFRKAQLLTYMQTYENTIGKVGELQVLLPQTYAKLQSADPSRFPELGDEYKTIFNEDLKSVVDNLIDHIDNHSAASNAALESKLIWLNSANVATIKCNQNYNCFKISADIGSKLINNYHPVELINFLDNKYYFDSRYYDATNSKSLLLQNPDSLHKKIILLLHGLNLVQKNVLDTTKSLESQFSNVWLNLQDLKKLDTKDEWLFFAGLIYQQDKDFFNSFVFNATGKTLTGSNAVTDAEIALLKTKVNTILSTLVEIQEFRSNLKEKNLKENYGAYMNLIFKSLESANTYSTTTLQIPLADMKKYLMIADYTMKIYDNARKKDYNNTVYYAIEILNQFLANNQNYLNIIITIEQYGNFMTDVINANNSDEVKDVIKKYAAPPSSFIQKREFQRTFSITGQPGYFGSIEKFDGKDQDFKFVSGITLPMGFEMTFKNKHGKENSASWGVFAQLLDLGAVLNFRVGDSTSTLPDKIEFEQLFSPGGSINYGFKNSPVTIGLGYQYTPQLRKITENGNEFFPDGHRIFLRLAWDIPLINIARSKTK